MPRLVLHVFASILFAEAFPIKASDNTLRAEIGASPERRFEEATLPGYGFSRLEVISAEASFGICTCELGRL